VDISPRGLARSAGLVGAAAHNAFEVARFGGLQTGEEPSEFEVVARRRMYRLRHYFPAAPRPDGPSPPAGPALLLIPPLMMTAEVYDVSPATSAVRILREAGTDPWVVDFGAPEREEGGLRRNVSDHVLAVSETVDLVRAATGRDVYLGGYSQGGMFAYQVAAYRRSEGLAGLVTFGAPVDTRATRLGRLSEDLVADVLSVLADRVLTHVTVPAWANRLGFKILDPVKATRSRIRFLKQLHDREALLPRERQRQFLDNEGYVAYPGPAIAELVKQFIAHNRMLSGGFLIGEQMSTLADITCPVLAFNGASDTIAPPPSVRAIRRAAPRADTYEATVSGGHFGLVVGTGASRHTWPTVAAWMRWREGAGEVPAGVRELLETDVEEVGPGPNLLEAGLDVAGAAFGVARTSLVSAAGGARAIGGLAADATGVLPRLVRLERAQGDHRSSLAQLLDERARKSPDDPFFVFDGRGHTYAAANERIDNVVRGLISIGVRHGEHVGVLMDTRPSAVTVIAALNRIGAVAALLRPDGAAIREAELAQVTRIIADPKHASSARAGGDLPVFALGGGRDVDPLDPGVTDMELIDPAAVALPAWYVPNPGRSSDLAFLLFTGEGARTRMSRITNGRWAMSAYGTASAARLSAADTVYSVTPLHHASGLLTSVGGAVAGGARLALTRSFDPTTFWEEVRRYGVTIVSYTWTLLRDLIEAEPGASERHHPVRLFVGSGMPAWLWNRAVDRFAPAGVLEFFASTEEGVVLANIDGEKVGAKGRPLPGAAEVRIVGYDVEAGALAEGADGFAVACGPNETGLLVARAPKGRATPRALRGLFAPEDAWLSTSHLFRRDADGDFWLIAHTSDLVHTAAGTVSPGPAEDAIGSLDAVDLVAAYGVRPAGPETDGPEVLVAAVQMRAGRSLSAEELSVTLRGLPPAERPAVIRCVAAIPLTTWWRPLRAALREQGLETSDGGWVLGGGGAYEEAPKGPSAARSRAREVSHRGNTAGV
jgi:putative long chain acyl-CoA synthase